MGKEQCITRHYHNMFEVSSMIQKSIRRQDYDHAYYAANELIPKYRNYLWKRLLTVSAEDCFDLVTHKVVEYRKKDDETSDKRYIALAVSTLLKARKNRDADYFACNLFNSRDEADITKYVAHPVKDLSCSTKNGHCMFDLEKVFNAAIQAHDDVMAGYAANELRVYYPKFTWRMIIKLADKFNLPAISEEIRALREADEETERTSIIFYSKALTILLKVVKRGNDDFYQKDYPCKCVDLGLFDKKYFAIPAYVFDVHTLRGKFMHKTRRDFIIEEQAALNPHVEGDYDNASWEHSFWLEKNGYYRNEYTPHPDKKRVAELEEGVRQQSLF